MQVADMTDKQRVALERKIERRIRSKAKKRVLSKLGFMWHIAVFFMVTLALILINLNYTPDRLWVVWPVGGWGAGLFLHGFATFTSLGMTEKMIEREIEREKVRRGIA